MNIKIKMCIDSSLSNSNMFFANEYLLPEHILVLDKEEDKDELQEKKDKQVKV